METKSFDKLLLLFRGDCGVTEEDNASLRTTSSVSRKSGIAAQQHLHESPEGLQPLIIPEDVSNTQDRLAVLRR